MENKPMIDELKDFLASKTEEDIQKEWDKMESANDTNGILADTLIEKFNLETLNNETKTNPPTSTVQDN